MRPTPLLLPFSWVYGAGVAARNLFFDIGFFKSVALPVPVLSVGSTFAGGAGKTPFVVLLATILRKRGKKVAIVSRGYGRSSKGYVVVSNGSQRCAEAFTAGDEPAFLADVLDGVVVTVDEVRSRGAANTVRDFKVDVVILDDAFQHRSLSRNSDIVLVRASDLSRRSHLLPAGYQREPWSSLKRADLIVVTKCRTPEDLEKASEVIDRRWKKPLMGTQDAVTGLTVLFTNETYPAEYLRGKNVLAVSGIAHPKSFEETVSGLGARIARSLRFPDHHWFRESDVLEMVKAVSTAGTDLVVTTEKDGVRLKAIGEVAQRMLSSMPVLAVKIETSVIGGQEVLEKMIRSL